MTIKEYVIKRLEEDDQCGDWRHLEMIWMEVREQFPHRCAGWTYILSIMKKWQCSKLALISSLDAAKVIPRPQGVPSDYITADVRSDVSPADMEAPGNTPSEIKRRRDLAFTECPQGAARRGKVTE